MDTRIFLSKSISDISLENITSEEKNVLDFEKSLEKYLGKKNCVAALNSGTSAIHLSLILSGVSHGDEVLCQSFTYVASANPTIYQGAIPIFIDSEKDTWNMCPKYLEKAILDRISKGKKPKAIIFVHLYGMPAKIEEISLIAKKYNIKLIEDAAEALGSEFKGKKCGTFGDYGIISFNNNKIVTTFGGGVLICKNEEDKQKAIYLSKQARDKVAHYQHSEIGYNYRISNVLAGIGVKQMKFLEKHISRRRNVNFFYKKFFKELKGFKLLEELNKNRLSNHWLSCVVIDEKLTGFNREDLRMFLLKNNIESRPFWKPMHLQPVFKEFPFYGEMISENLFNNGLCLPSGSDLEITDLERITSSIKKLL
ncbi:DegT/DnrJ/EryC1/StrS family aminotransferase [uncultured Polaribacter sp.]|uniref:DegT/DnrJ/EryC1/StrS family aminotransferase n=1 Tax=uncultured Polaribacter sp. TaxID=174711 RepID=UPI002618BF77|nr:DegT/DnrJ/EryC1/StrS family aminotransferase [uncultured Polaribacter sp.]